MFFKSERNVIYVISNGDYGQWCSNIGTFGATASPDSQEPTCAINKTCIDRSNRMLLVVRGILVASKQECLKMSHQELMMSIGDIPLESYSKLLDYKTAESTSSIIGQFCRFDPHPTR